MKEGHRNIQTLMADMLPHLERSGLSERAYRMPTGEIANIDPQLQIDATDFVIEVRDSIEFDNLLSARQLVTEEQWADYDTYQFKGLQEQRIYAAALQEFQKLWNTDRPSYWGKHYERYEEQFEGEAAGTDGVEETAS